MYRRASGQANQLVPQFAATPLMAKIWRQYHGLSQVELSGRIGKSQAYLAQIENGKRERTIATYRTIAQALKVDLDEIVGP